MQIDKRPKVSIVIPAYNSADTLRDTLEACLGQDYPKDKLEVIVVDDGSEDNTGKIVRSLPVKYMRQERKGPASARNNGWRNSKGEAICFIDSDCAPSKNWVSGIVKHFYEDKVGAVAGSYDVEGSRYLLDKSVHYEIRYRHSMMPVYINSFGTYNVLIKRSVLQELEGFDPAYCTASGEDSDLSYRIIKAGYRIYFEKETLVNHRSVLKFLKYIRVQFKHGYWRMKLYKKNFTMIARDQYGYWKDFVEVGLVMAFFLSVVLNLKSISVLLLFFLFVIQLPLSVKMSLEQKDIRYMVFSFVTFIRAFARFLGGMIGFISFCLIKR